MNGLTTAIEKMADFCSAEYDQKIGFIKDIRRSAVMLVSIAASINWPIPYTFEAYLDIY